MICAFRAHTRCRSNSGVCGFHRSHPHVIRQVGTIPGRWRIWRYPHRVFHVDIAQVQTAEGKAYRRVAINRARTFKTNRQVERADRRTA